MSRHDTAKKVRQPLHLRLASLGAASIAFIAAFEPNTALRFGPFIAIAVLALANPSRLRIGKTELALIAYVAWSFLSQFWTVAPTLFIVRFTIVLSLAVMFLGIRAAIRYGNSAPFVLGGYVIGCVVGLGLTSLEFLTGGAILRDVSGRVTQVDDLNVNYVAYGCVTAIVLLVFTLRTQSVAARRLRILVWAALVFLAIGVISTQTRGAQIALGLFAVWLVISRFGKPLKLVVTTAAVAAFAVSSGWVNDQLDLLDYGARSLSGLSGRLQLWEIARDAWRSEPIIGIGVGGTRTLNANQLPTHNTFLELLATVGVIGFLLFLLFVCFSQTDRLEGLTDGERRFRIASTIIAFLPILLSSAWEMSASGWVGLALLSQPLRASLRSGEVDEVVSPTHRRAASARAR